jgi:hypothetical protein
MLMLCSLHIFDNLILTVSTFICICICVWGGKTCSNGQRVANFFLKSLFCQEPKILSTIMFCSISRKINLKLTNKKNCGELLLF